MSRITVVGTGYVGLTTAACFADLGNDVWGLDVDENVVATLRLGEVGFYEPGLQEIVDRNVASERLRFTTCYSEAIPSAEFVFIAVGTPMAGNGEADLAHVRQAATAIAGHLNGPAVIVNKSTVPIGTGDLVSDIIRAIAPAAADHVRVVSNPEFLREGSAIRDFMEPDRVVLGAHDPEAAALVADLYKPLGAAVLVTNPYTAEMIKYASNAFLATKISFINEIARVCEKLDADVNVVAEGMGLDQRIGRPFLDAGIGYGGSCFPKDVMALSHTSSQIGAHPQLLDAVMEINRSQPHLLIDKIHDLLGTLRQQAIGILGLSFKPNTDDMRGAPSLVLIGELHRRGALIRAYDPAAMTTAHLLVPYVTMVEDAYSAAESADALIVVTEWNEFRQLDLGRIHALMRRPVIIDGRNVYDPAEVRKLGFIYRGIGR